jgi:hypothetical protein
LFSFSESSMKALSSRHNLLITFKKYKSINAFNSCLFIERKCFHTVWIIQFKLNISTKFIFNCLLVNKKSIFVYLYSDKTVVIRNNLLDIEWGITTVCWILSFMKKKIPLKEKIYTQYKINVMTNTLISDFLCFQI